MKTTRLIRFIAMLVIASGSLMLVPSARAMPADTMLASGRHLELVNATFDSVIAVAIAPAHRENFNDVVLGEPLQGGRTSTTVDVPAGGCLRDLRVTFHGGRDQLLQGINVCKISGLRLAAQGGR
jgi:hypothetical protein